MSDVSPPPTTGNTMASESDGSGFSLSGLLVLLASVGLLGLCYAMGWTLAFYGAAVVVISVVIWQVCDPFADAAQWIGTEMQIPGSVRGATLDAVASSMPELFTGIFFVWLAISGTGGDELRSHAGSEGYGSAIATCAGSAVYNMILIPASCALIISWFRPSRPTIDVEDEVVKRDGLWFMFCETTLVVFLFLPRLHYWMGLVMLGLYVAYVTHLYIDAKRYRRKLPRLREKIAEMGLDADPVAVRQALLTEKVNVSRVLVMKVQEELRAGEDPETEEDDEPEEAGVLFGLVDIPLSHATAWPILFFCTLLAAGACYFLVEVTEGISETLQVDAFFIAVIVAAAASSVPDTFLSIGASTRGDDDGAVSNAFGSNIFDICICLSVPLLLACYLNGWDPVPLQNAEGGPIEGLEGLAGLRILLLVLSALTLGLIWHNRQLTRGKAFVLIGLYLVFVGYAILGAKGSREADPNEPVASIVIDAEPAAPLTL